MGLLKFSVDNDANGKRLDVAIANLSELTRSSIKRACDNSLVTVNGKVAAAKTLLKEGDLVELNLPEENRSRRRPKTFL